MPCANGDPLSASAGPQAADSLAVVISISRAAFHPTKCLTVIRCSCEWLHCHPQPQAAPPAPSALATDTQLQAWGKQMQVKRKPAQEEADHGPQAWRARTETSKYTRKQTQDESKVRPECKRNRVNCSALAYNPGIQRQTSNTVVDSARANRDTCTLHNTECPSGGQVNLPGVPHLSSISHSGLLHMLFLLPGTPFLNAPSLHG